MKKVALHNLGCKVNAYETEAMRQLLEEDGYEIVPFKEGADVYVVNTCTVTNIADRKSRQMLHKARKMNPDAVVVAAGCYVQAQAEKQVIDPCIDIVLGNNKKQDLLIVDTDETGIFCVRGRKIDDIEENPFAVAVLTTATMITVLIVGIRSRSGKRGDSHKGEK